MIAARRVCRYLPGIAYNAGGDGIAHCASFVSGYSAYRRYSAWHSIYAYCVKVPRTGAVLILAVLVGLITSMASIYPMIAAVVWGLLAEIILAKGRRKSPNALLVSYCVFNLTAMGPFFSLLLARTLFLRHALSITVNNMPRLLTA